MTYLYVVKQKTKKGVLTKIGHTNNPERRFKEIKSDTKKSIKVLFSKQLDDTLKTEVLLHHRYKGQNVPYIGRGKCEWFRLSWFQRLILVSKLKAGWFLTALKSALKLFLMCFAAISIALIVVFAVLNAYF